MKIKSKTKVQPRKILKHSDIVKQQEKSLLVAGYRIPTKTGFRVNGTCCDDYETFYEVLIEGSVTDSVVSSKGTRSIRVLSGHGVAVVKRGDVSKEVILTAGEEVVLTPNIVYSLASHPSTKLEILVSQSAKYDETLTVVEEASTQVELDESLFESVTREDVLTKNLTARKRTGRSKAAEQQKARAASMGKSNPAPMGPIVTEGVNVRPSLGKMDWEGAG